VSSRHEISALSGWLKRLTQVSKPRFHHPPSQLPPLLLLLLALAFSLLLDSRIEHDVDHEHEHE
jgi:hypothetical protein